MTLIINFLKEFLKDLYLEIFKTNADIFEDLIKSDNIPTAAIGYFFNVTEELETVTKLAEEMMYADKHQFYKQFPQFKRAIAECEPAFPIAFSIHFC